MKQSTERILTSHTGSLPRPPDLVAAHLSAEGLRAEGEHLREQMLAAVREIQLIVTPGFAGFGRFR